MNYGLQTPMLQQRSAKQSWQHNHLKVFSMWRADCKGRCGDRGPPNMLEPSSQLFYMTGECYDGLSHLRAMWMLSYLLSI